jgi:molybdopterin converting factor small subunit
MKTTVIIPSVFRRYTGNNKELKIEGYTIDEVLENLTIKYFPLRKQVFSEFGDVRSYINVYLNGKDIKLIEAEKLPLKENDIIKIIPCIIGGVKD